MIHEQKQQVKDALVRYSAGFNTQTEAAASLVQVSPALITQVANDVWELISERTWHHLARQVGFYSGEWYPADTSGYMLLRILFNDAMHFATCYGIAMGSGLGKTFAASHYKREHENALYLACNDVQNRRVFMQRLLEAAGLKPEGDVPRMIAAFTACINEKEGALLIIDDAHTLKDRVLHLIVLLANKIAGRCGIALMGNEELRRRITEGVRLKKKGYGEVYKNFGSRFITVGRLSPGDIGRVCSANGVNDGYTISLIADECNGSLYRIPQLIAQYNQMSMAA